MLDTAPAAAGVARTPPLAATASSPAWIQSRRYDLALLLLVPLLPIPPLLLAADYPAAMLVPGIVLGFSHYLSTFTFFAWDEYRERHRARWLAFFGGPAAIVAAVLALALLRIPLVIPVALFFWNTFHVARQSAGVASVYRHRAGVMDPGDQRVANAAIVSTSLFLSLLNVASHRQVSPVLNAIPGFGPALQLATGAAALVCLVALANRLRQRRSSGKPASGPELVSLGCGLTLFHPYLWVPDSGLATAGMLLGHFVQYLGIVWLLHHRRFRRAADGSLGQRTLAVVSARAWRIVAVISVVGFGVLGGFELSKLLGLEVYFEGMYLTLAFVHFYLDGLFWAFKDPSVRRSLGPYLAGFRFADAAS